MHDVAMMKGARTTGSSPFSLSLVVAQSDILPLCFSFPTFSGLLSQNNSQKNIFANQI